MGSRLGIDAFIDKAKSIHDDKYDYSNIKEYVNNKTKYKIKCIKHGYTFEMRADSHMQGQGCRKCKSETLSKLKLFTKEDFINRSILVHGDKYIYDKAKYKGSDIAVEIICKLHGKFKQSPHSHIGKQKSGCPLCGKERADNLSRKTIIDFINESNIIHNGKYIYNKVNYVNNKTKIIITCPFHGDFKTTSQLHITQKCGCPKCNISLGEERICKFLTESGISYKYQHRFDGCIYKNKLVFDFFIPEAKICIEYDGHQHFQKVSLFKNDLNLQKVKDDIKNKYCVDNNILLIRIAYYNYDNIIEILSNKLNQFISLEKGEKYNYSLRKFVNYNEAKEILKTQNIKINTTGEFYRWTKTDSYDNRIPKSPSLTYKSRNEWVSFPDFLSLI